MILSEIEAQIIIIPHVQDGLNDDRILASDIHKSFNYDPRIHLAGGDHSASEFKGLISACDMLVAERMHAAIAGLSSGVCTVVVGYSVKAEGIVTDLLGTDSLSKDSLISIQDFINGELACNTIQKAWNSREKVADKLREVLPIIKGKAAENFQLILSAQ
jgi:colanic acid/amylovoran biosynthesis protein